MSTQNALFVASSANMFSISVVRDSSNVVSIELLESRGSDIATHDLIICKLQVVGDLRTADIDNASSTLDRQEASIHEIKKDIAMGAQRQL